MDFKGDFPLVKGRRCCPLTVSDTLSRYLLVCQALARLNNEAVRPWREWGSREDGLPEAIRTNIGAPFALLALGGRRPLAKCWIQLRIRHKRMHRTLKAAVPPQANLLTQPRHYEPFRHEYNWQRSHQTPGSVYRGSSRPYPLKLPPPLSMRRT